MTAIGHSEDRLITDQVADVAAITPTATGEYVAESREEFLSSTLEPLSQELDTPFETFEHAHKHEKELGQAVETTTSSESDAPIYYKIAIVVLVLWLEVI